MNTQHLIKLLQMKDWEKIRRYLDSIGVESETQKEGN